MSLYIDADTITDETSSSEAVLAALADRLNAALNLDEDESWEPAEGTPETSLGEAVGIVLATAMAMVQDQERIDYAGFGEVVLDAPRQPAEPAEAISRWTFDDDGAHLVPDGSELVLDTPDGTPVGFATVGDFEFVGTTVDIPIVAIEPGAETNNLTGAARDFEPLPHLADVTLTTVSSGGSDEETLDEYVDKVVRKARRMKLVPIVTDDYADTALDHPSVNSAVAVRLLNLAAPTDPPAAAGHVTVFVRGDGGTNLSADIKEEVRLLMMGDDRPLAVTVHVGDPTRTDVTIAVSLRLVEGADELATIGAVQAAISAAYSDSTYGYDESAAGRWRVPRTDAERTINDYDVTAVIDDIDGVAKIEDVTINGGRSVTLLGWAPLPNLTAPAVVTVLT
jgi:hypothetical protein